MSAEMHQFWVTLGFAGYFGALDLVTIAAYALWVGPERFGATEPWPLVAYFIVAYVGVLLVAYGIIAAIPGCDELIRRGRAWVRMMDG
jgi:hypothetical protein